MMTLEIITMLDLERCKNKIPQNQTYIHIFFFTFKIKYIDLKSQWNNSLLRFLLFIFGV